MANLIDKRIAVLATHGFEKSELVIPLETLRGWGAVVVVVSPESGEIRSWDDGNWGAATPVDMALSEARADDFDAIVLPGGQINPDVLRANEMAVALIRDFYTAGKTIGAICHAPWLLIEAGVAQTGATMTSYHSIRRDVENAGAAWIDEPVVADQGVVTSRKPDDLEAFCAKLREEVLKGAHVGRQNLAA